MLAKTAKGGVGAATKGVDKSTSAKRVRGPPLVWSPVSADASGSRGASLASSSWRDTPARWWEQGRRKGPPRGPPEGSPGVPGAVIQPAGDHKGGFPTREKGGSLVILTDVHQHVPVGEGAAERRGAIILEEHSSQPNKQVNKYN